MEIGGNRVAHQENIYDRMMKELPAERKEQLNERYSSISLHPEDIRFIDRMVADSRQVALNHTAGLFAAATDTNVSVCVFRSAGSREYL